jgi:hypothetical protein
MFGSTGEYDSRETLIRLSVIAAVGFGLSSIVFALELFVNRKKFYYLPDIRIVQRYMRDLRRYSFTALRVATRLNMESNRRWSF